VVSQTGIHYRQSALSRSLATPPDSAPQAGDRFPWLRLKMRTNGGIEDLFQVADDARFNLVLFGQTLPSGHAHYWTRLVDIHAVPDDPANRAELARARIPPIAFYLLRPDGHIGLCGTWLDTVALDRYMAECMHLAATTQS
jgi:hypothetical protein